MLSMFSQIVAATYHNTAHLNGSTEIYASKLASQEKLNEDDSRTLERLSVFFGYNETASFYWTTVSV